MQEAGLLATLHMMYENFLQPIFDISFPAQRTVIFIFVFERCSSSDNNDVALTRHIWIFHNTESDQDKNSLRAQTIFREAQSLRSYQASPFLICV